jgi:hypothetical protein
VAFLGLALLVVGILIGHGAQIVWSEAHEPKTLATVESQKCYDDQTSDGDQQLCNVAVRYVVDGHEHRGTMGAIDAGTIQSNTITIAYPVSHPSLIVPASENTDRLAILFGGIAVVFFGSAFACLIALFRQLKA